MENTIGYKVLGAFRPEELIIVNFYAPKNWPEDAPDTWANTLVTEARGDCYAADFEGSTDGDQTAINVLMPKEDLPEWEAKAKEIGCEVEISDLSVGSGRHGCESGDISCILAEAGDLLYWIEV